MSVVIWIVIGVAVLLVLYVIYKFNSFIRKRNRTQEAWAQIDVQLRRRHDLIPNLIETVKGYAAHERQTFEAVTQARAAALNVNPSGDPQRIAPAENALSQSLRSLMAVVENYPQLRAVETFLQLQEELTATEDKIAFSRHYYNGSVRDYNIALQTFPGNIVASMMKFKPVPFFQADEGDRVAPTVTGFGPDTPAP